MIVHWVSRGKVCRRSLRKSK